MGILNLSSDANRDAPQDKPSTQNDTDKDSTESDQVEVTSGASVDEAQEETAKSRVVIMDGPLSRVYTEALNMAYAKEDTGTMAMKIVRHEQREGASLQLDPALVDEHGTYVYAIDDRSLDKEGLVPVLETLRTAVKSGKYSQVVLALEARTVSSKMQLLDEASTLMGVKVRVSRSSAVRTVLGAHNKA